MAKTSGKSNVKQIQKIAQKKRSKKSPLSVTVTTKAGPAKALSSKAASAKAALRKAASSKAVSAEEDSAKKRSKLHPIKSSQATPSSNKKRTIVISSSEEEEGESDDEYLSKELGAKQFFDDEACDVENGSDQDDLSEKHEFSENENISDENSSGDEDSLDESEHGEDEYHAKSSNFFAKTNKSSTLKKFRKSNSMDFKKMANQLSEMKEQISQVRKTQMEELQKEMVVYILLNCYLFFLYFFLINRLSKLEIRPTTS
jgi:hypothetical protein